MSRIIFFTQLSFNKAHCKSFINGHLWVFFFWKVEYCVTKKPLTLFGEVVLDSDKKKCVHVENIKYGLNNLSSEFFSSNDA